MNPGFPHLHLPTLAESQKPTSLLAEPPDACTMTATAEPPGPIAVPAPPTGEPNPNHPHPSDLPKIEIPVVAPPAPPVIEVVTETMISEQPVVSPVPQPESTTEPERTVVTSDLGPPSEVHPVQSEVAPTVPVEQYMVPVFEQTTPAEQYEPPQETTVVPRIEADHAVDVYASVEPPDGVANAVVSRSIPYLSLVDGEETAAAALYRALDNGMRFIAQIEDNTDLIVAMSSSLDKWRTLEPYITTEVGSGQGLAIWLDVCGYLDIAALFADDHTQIAFPGTGSYTARDISHALSVAVDALGTLNEEVRIFDSVEYRPIIPSGWARLDGSGNSAVLDDEEYHAQLAHKMSTAELRTGLIADLSKLAAQLARATANGDEK